MKRTGAWVLGAAMVIAVVGMTRCRRGDAGRSTTAAPAPAAPAASADEPRRAGESPESVTAVQAPPNAAAATAPGPSTFSRLSERYERHDLRLLAEVREATGGQMPPAIETLLELRRDQAAGRDVLFAHINDHVRPLLVRSAAHRWLAREFPDASAVPAQPEVRRAPSVAPLQRRPRD